MRSEKKNKRAYSRDNLAVRDDCVPARECLARSGLVGRVGPRGWTPPAPPAVRLLRVLGQVLGAEFYFQLACVKQLAPASTLVQDRGRPGTHASLLGRAIATRALVWPHGTAACDLGLTKQMMHVV